MFSFHLEEFMFSYKRPNLTVTINATRPYEHRFQKCSIHYLPLQISTFSTSKNRVMAVLHMLTKYTKISLLKH